MDNRRHPLTALPTCTHHILPSSLRIQARNNNEFATYFAQMLPAFRHWTLTVHSSIVDEAQKTVVMKVTSRADTDLRALRERVYAGL